MTGTRAFYEEAYSTGDPAERERLGRWRALGAEVKAGHVRKLLDETGTRPDAIVEIGCGDGSLLAQLAQIATVDGFELSPIAAGYARERNVARKVEAFDGRHVPAADDAYDLAVLSHVLEHVPDPLPLLREARRLAPHVVVEVPLEDNWSARRPRKRQEAARIGHLHAFNGRQVREIVSAAGLTPRAELSDPLPYKQHAFLGGPALMKWAVRAAIHKAGGAERLFTVHYAVLATRA